jgi:type I restriction enzyme M protein
MSIVKDVPVELKEFARTFEKLCYRHGDYGRVFSDFIDYWTAGMLVEGDKELADYLKNRYGNDYTIFNCLVMDMLKAYDKVICREGKWYDGFGLFYECISSKYKSSALGQFFTPEPIVDLICAIVNPVVKNTVCDCCSGSGRMLLSAKVRSPQSKFYGSDLDPVCAKMTALNMALHGCQGESSCMDALCMNWKFGYYVNPYFFMPGINPVPHLVPIESYENSIFYASPKIVEEAIEVAKENVNKKGQYSLF